MNDLPSDRGAHREWLLSLLRVPPAAVVVDLGCGRGEDLCSLAATHPGRGLRFVGLDGSEPSLTTARVRSADDGRIDFQLADLEAPLPFEDASVDVVYSHNLLECVADPVALAREAGRVLRPGGQTVIGHWDWDSQLWDSADKNRLRRLVHAFADWQQAWMAHADGWMGRRLWGVLNATRLFEGELHARVLLNTEYEPGAFGYENAQVLRSLVRHGLAEAADVDGFLSEQEELAAAGRYVYSLTGYAYVGTRSGLKR